MRAPMIPGRKPDDDQREAMLRRLGIAEEKPPMPSRWDVLARDMEPVAPVQTPPPMVDEIAAAADPLPSHEPIPMAEAMRAQEALAPEPEPEQVAPSPVMEAPVQTLRAIESEPALQTVVEPVRIVEPEPAPTPEALVPDASFMPGWGEESIPEDEEAEAELADDPAPLAAAPDEPLAEAPHREDLLPKIERPVSYSAPPPAETVANDEDLSIPEPQAPAPFAPPVMEAPVAAAPTIEPTPEPTVTRAPVIEPVVQPVAAPEPVIEAPVVQPVIVPPAPEPEPVVQRAAPAQEPVIERPAPAPAPEPEPAIQRLAPAPEPAPEPPVMRQAPAPEPIVEPAPPVDSALREMRAELEAMRKQFQTAPAPPLEAAPLAAAIPYDGRRRSRQQTDFFANARMVVWTLAIVAALWVTFHGMQAARVHQAKQDHIMATVTGKEAAEDQADDQKNDN
jgi:hypothetical protein